MFCCRLSPFEAVVVDFCASVVVFHCVVFLLASLSQFFGFFLYLLSLYPFIVLFYSSSFLAPPTPSGFVVCVTWLLASPASFLLPLLPSPTLLHLFLLLLLPLCRRLLTAGRLRAEQEAATSWEQVHTQVNLKEGT